MTHVFSLGIAVLDTVYSCQTIPDAATKYKANAIETVTGGGASNAAIAIAKLGGHAHLAARLGDDPQGAAIRADLAAHGVNVDALHVTPNGQTSSSSIIVDQKGERQIVNFRGANLSDSTKWITLPGATKSVLADTRWPAGLHRALALAQKANIPGIVDVDTPLDACDFSNATHLAFARHALTEMTQETDIAAGLLQVAKRYKAWACVTDGAAGCYMLQDGEMLRIPAPKVAVVDTLGAAAAALKCTQKGVANGMPDRATVDKLSEER